MIIILELAIALGLILAIYKVVMKLISLWQEGRRTKNETDMMITRIAMLALTNENPDMITDTLAVMPQLTEPMRKKLEQRRDDLLIEQHVRRFDCNENKHRTL